MINFDSSILNDDEVQNRFLTKDRFKELFYQQAPTGTSIDKKMFVEKANELGYKIEGINDNSDNRNTRGLGFNSIALNTVLQENKKLREAGLPDNVLNDEQLQFVLNDYAKGFSSKENAFNDLLPELANKGIMLDKPAYENIKANYKGALDANGNPLPLSSIKSWSPSFADNAIIGTMDLLKHPLSSLKAMAQNVGSVVGLAEDGSAEKTLQEAKDVGNFISEGQQGDKSGTTTQIGADDISKSSLLAGDIITSFIPVSGILNKVKYLNKVPTAVGFLGNTLDKAGFIGKLTKFLAISGGQTAKTLAITEGDIDPSEHIYDYALGGAFSAVGKMLPSLAGRSGKELTDSIIKESDNILSAITGDVTGNKTGIKEASSKFIDRLSKTDPLSTMISKGNELREELGGAISDIVIAGDKPLSMLGDGISNSRLYSKVAQDLNFLSENLSGKTELGMVNVIDNGSFKNIPFSQYFSEVSDKYNTKSLNLSDLQNIRTILSSKFSEKMFKNSGDIKATQIANNLADSRMFYSKILGEILGKDFSKVNSDYSNHLSLMDLLDESSRKTGVENIASKSDKVIKSSIAEDTLRAVNPMTYIRSLNAKDIPENVYRAIEDASNMKLDPEKQTFVFDTIKNAIFESLKKAGVANDLPNMQLNDKIDTNQTELGVQAGQ